MGRDHSIPCAKCGTYYGGMLGPSVCGCELPRSDSVRIYPGPSCEHTERIETLEATLTEINGWLSRHSANLAESIATTEQRIAKLEADAAALTELRRAEAKIAISTSTTTPRPSKRGKGRRK